MPPPEGGRDGMEQQQVEEAGVTAGRGEGRGGAGTWVSMVPGTGGGTRDRGPGPQTSRQTPTAFGNRPAADRWPWQLPGGARAPKRNHGRRRSRRTAAPLSPRRQQKEETRRQRAEGGSCVQNSSALGARESLSKERASVRASTLGSGKNNPARRADRSRRFRPDLNQACMNVQKNIAPCSTASVF